MANIYRHTFVARCPNNGQNVVYRLAIETMERIMVERIMAACKAVEGGYHEEIADALSALFGGRQTLAAFHHGVHIDTTRGTLTTRPVARPASGE